MSFMRINQTKLADCYELQPDPYRDHRGIFVKPFHREVFAELGLETDIHEQIYSCSAPGVLRGLHFQIPPREHTKLVYCLAGRVLDAVVDLRVGSPTYGQYELFDLNAEKRNLVYVPAGMAHGFYVTGDSPAVVSYNVSTVHSPEHDRGIRWDSAGIPWPDRDPILSEKDRKAPLLADFRSPFRYKAGGTP